MHGQNLACSLAETLSSCSPRPLLYGHGSVLQDPSAFLAARSPRFETDFSSPAATAPFREPPRRGQRSCPISSAQLRTFLPARSALNSHPRLRSSRRRGMFAAQSPLPSSKPEALRLPSNFRSPSGLSSLRIVALSQRLGLRNLPLSPARFPFAPRMRQLLLITNPPTDHRSRFATVYQAYCSLNLLEPCPCCPEMAFQSTVNCI